MKQINSFKKRIGKNLGLLVGLTIVFSFFQLSQSYGQARPQHYYEVPVSIKPTIEIVPFTDPNSGNRNEEYVSQWLYFPGDFGTSIPTGREISAIYFKAAKPDIPAEYSEFTVALKQANITTLDSLSYETGLDTVRNSATFTVSGIRPDDWFKIELDNTFPFNPNMPLIVETSQKDVTKGSIFVWAGGSPVNTAYANATTQIYGEYGVATPSTGRTNTYAFGFDLVAGPVANDVGVVALDSPAVICNVGNYDVYATIKNFGTNEVNSVNVFWEVDGVPQGSIQYNGLLDSLRGTRGNSALVRLGSYNFQGPVEVKIYTDRPNGVSDGRNTNDTLIQAVRPALNGNYTVDRSLPASVTNFTSLSSLAQALNEVGVCGPTYISVVRGTYNEVLSLQSIPGASAVNHIVIDGGDSSQTIISQNGSIAYATLSFEGTKHVRVQNMGIRMTGTQGVAVNFVNAELDTLSNCATWVQTTSPPPSTVFNMLFSGASGSTVNGSSKYIVVQNNDIKGGYRGIYVSGNNNDLSPYNQFYNNNIDSAYFYGAFFTYQDSLEFTGNKVNTYDNKGLDAVTLDYCNNFHIKQNYIFGNRRGLEVKTQTAHTSIPRRNEVSNNMIYGRNSYPAAYFSNTDSLKFYHNSIFAEGGIPALSIYNSATVLPDMSGYDIRNNILASENGVAINIQVAGNVTDSTLFEKLDFNIYYTYGNGNLFSMSRGGVRGFYSSLADYITDYPRFNQKSIQGDPEYLNLINPTDLHILGSLPSEKGDNTVGITVDIDGEVRPGPTTTNVDIGADEFFPLVCYRPLNADVSGITMDSVTIKWDRDSARSLFHEEYAYVIVPCDSSPYSVPTILTNSDSLRVGGLTAGTCYQFYVREVCTRGDTSFWTVPIKFYTPYTIPYFEDFEVFPANLDENPWPNGWTSTKSQSLLPRWNSMSGTPSTQLNSGPSVDHTTGTASGKYICLRTRFSAPPPNDSVDFISPMIYIDSSLTSFELSYWYHAYGAGVHGMDIYIDTNGVRNHVAGFYGRQHTNRTDPWLKDSVLISGYAGEFIQVVFRGRNGTQGNSNLGMIAIDDIALKAGPSCPPPYNVSVTPTSTSTVDLEWSSFGAGVTLEYGLKGFTRGSGTIISGVSSPYTISGLQSNFIYEVYLQDSCNVLDKSIFTNAIEFSTLPLNCDDFDHYTLGDLVSQSSLFKGWAGNAGDAVVTDEEMYSSPYSLKIHDSGLARMSNVVADVGVHNAGIWSVKFDFLVPNSYSGAYNVLYDYDGNNSEVAFEVYLDSSGLASVAGRTSIGTFPFVKGAWNTIEHVIDLDNDTALIYINGDTTAVLGWAFESNVHLYGDQFNAISFNSQTIDNQVSLTYYDNFCVSEFTSVPFYPIGILNTTDVDGIPDSLNVTAWTEGQVAGVNLHSADGLSYTLIDGSGSTQEGIHVYSDIDLRGFVVNEGEKVRVRGTVELVNGLTQMRIDAINEYNTSGSLLARPSNNLDESTESQYIRMRNFVLLDPSQSGNSTYNIRAYNGGDTITIRIHENTDVSDSLALVHNALTAGDTICVLVGIGGQYDTSSTAPYLSGYHITPMFFDDLQICKLPVGISKNVNATDEVLFYPNPTNGSFTIESLGLETDNIIITVRDISGKVVLRDNIANSTNTFKKSYNLEGQAKGLYLISIIDGDNIITKKLILQ